MDVKSLVKEKKFWLASVLGLASMDVKSLVKEKKFWFAFVLIAWAAGLQGHMMWMQKQEAFKQKFKTLNENNDGES